MDHANMLDENYDLQIDTQKLQQNDRSFLKNKKSDSQTKKITSIDSRNQQDMKVVYSHEILNAMNGLPDDRDKSFVEVNARNSNINQSGLTLDKSTIMIHESHDALNGSMGNHSQNQRKGQAVTMQRSNSPPFLRQSRHVSQPSYDFKITEPALFNDQINIDPPISRTKTKFEQKSISMPKINLTLKQNIAYAQTRIPTLPKRSSPEAQKHLKFQTENGKKLKNTRKSDGSRKKRKKQSSQLQSKHLDSNPDRNLDQSPDKRLDKSIDKSNMSDESQQFILNIDNSKKDIKTGERQLSISQMELRPDERKKLNAREKTSKDLNYISAPQAPTKISHINIGIDFDKQD